MPLRLTGELRLQADNASVSAPKMDKKVIKNLVKLAGVAVTTKN